MKNISRGDIKKAMSILEEDISYRCAECRRPAEFEDAFRPVIALRRSKPHAHILKRSPRGLGSVLGIWAIVEFASSCDEAGSRYLCRKCIRREWEIPESMREAAETHAQALPKEAKFYHLKVVRLDKDPAVAAWWALNKILIASVT